MSKPTEQDVRDFLKSLLSHSDAFVNGSPPNAYDRKSAREGLMLEAKELLLKFEPAVLRKDTEMSVTDLGLPIRISNRLVNQGILTVADLQEYSLVDLIVLPNMGRASIKYIDIAMTDFRWDVRDRGYGQKPIPHVSPYLPEAQLKRDPATYRTDTERSIRDLGLSYRLFKVFNKRDILTVEDILSHSLADLRQLPDMGVVSLKEAEAAMADYVWEKKSHGLTKRHDTEFSTGG